ncbi:hypothetical protein TRFO_11215 [Tritrichomonas foetus]|uniref:Uncharacterized protein n=1 Tax=Tritrichomonas foetus TaxID=1144522 RepID=A0A1J4J4V1_9EUKA|nr:hypothetical protein TRFO_11215 [Tritrichomonas foetus]|eukprot:OHS94352.1 hypothetical protein TRFO_11215 [Tritrichomonas foetus]
MMIKKFNEKIKMEEISSDIEACKSPSIEPTEITRVLVRLQNEINWQFLRPYPMLDRENFFTRLWNFLLFSAAHSNTSVRLAAYRTTGAFLLKVTPYYPNEIMKTFADIALASTIDMKSSAIIASSFAFISNFNALPYLEDFLRKTPVFHHFSISNPIFSDHLAPIIRNLGRLGIDWLCTLLHSFLEKAVHSTDRYLILSITAIVKHDPIKLMNELLLFIRDQSQVEDNLSLVSYLFSVIDYNFEELDLRDVVEAALHVLTHLEKSTATEIDSSFQILSIKSPSFTIKIEKISENDNNDDLKNASIKINVTIDDKVSSVTLPIAPYLNRPSFFLLPLPLDILHTSEADGVLQLTAKFKTMAKIVNKPETPKEEREFILDQFSSFLSASYNDRTSACMQGLAICLPSFLKYTDECSIVNLAKHAIFAQSQSWFHSSDILRIIKSIPFSFYGKSFKTEAILDVVIGFAMSTNDKLYNQASKVIAKIVNNTDFAKETLYIAKKCDFYDSFALNRILSILIASINLHNQKASLSHLNFLVKAILEILSDYQDDKELFITILTFFSCFDLSFVDISDLRPCFLDAFAIVHSSLSLLTGLQWDSKLDPAKLEVAMEMIQEDMKGMNYDIISETAMNYAHFLSPFAASLMFIYALPTKMVQLKFIINLFSRTLNLFPYQSALFAKKYWEGFTDIHRNEVIQRVYPTLEFVQDYATTAIWCHLFITMEDSEFVEQLAPCRVILHRIAKFAIDHNDFYPEFYAFEIFISEDVHEISEIINEKLNDQQTKELINYLTESHVNLLHKLNNDPNPEPLVLRRRLSIGFSESVTSLVDAPPSAGIESDEETNIELKELHSANHMTNSTSDKVEEGAVIISKPEIIEHSGEIEQIILTEFNSLHITFNFNVTKEMLASSLVEKDINNPIIKTQLKMQTFHFTDEHLSRLVRTYINSNDIYGLNTLIKYLFAQRKLISVKGIMFPSEVIPILFRYLKRLNSPELEGLIKYYQASPSNFEILLECRASNPKSYFDTIKSLDHLTKKDIYDFSRSVLRCQLNPSELIDFALNLLQECKSLRRCQYVLVLLNTIFSKISMIPSDSIEKFISIVNEKFDVIPGILISQCLLTLSTKVGMNQPFISLVKRFFIKCDGRASGVLRLHQIVLNSPDISAQTLILITASLLKAEIPSMISKGARFFLSIMKTVPDSILQNLLKQNLPLLTEPLVAFCDDYPVAEDIGMSLTHILTSPNLKSHYPTLLINCSNLIPTHDRACFAALSLCLPQLIAIHTEMTDDLIRLFKISDSLVTKPGSLFLFKIYLKALRERAEKAENTQQKESFISDYITSWMQNCKDYDCYQMPEFVYEWENLIFKFYGLEQLLSMVCYQFFKYMPRFFPLFIGFSRFVRRYMISANQNEVNMIEDALKSAALINSQRAHALSLLLLNKPEYYRTALDLAAFPEDCDESESIINSNPEFGDLLASYMG